MRRLGSIRCLPKQSLPEQRNDKPTICHPAYSAPSILRWLRVSCRDRCHVSRRGWWPIIGHYPYSFAYMIQFHHSIPAALTHAGTWAGFSGVLTSLGSQVDKPISSYIYISAAICGMIAIITRSPDKEEECPSHSPDSQ